MPRPLGSKNKKTLEREAAAAAEGAPPLEAIQSPDLPNSFSANEMPRPEMDDEESDALLPVEEEEEP